MRKVVYLLTFFMLTNCNNGMDNKVYKSFDNKICTISNYGVNNINVGVSTIDDVLSEFGDVKIQKKWIRGEFEIFGHYEYFLDYEKLGILFNGVKRDGIKIITYIKINSKSNCETQKGIGIGNTYEEVKNEFGQPLFHTKTNGRTYEPNLWYQQEGGKEFIRMTYKNLWIKFNDSDSAKSIVHEIEIF